MGRWQGRGEVGRGAAVRGLHMDGTLSSPWWDLRGTAVGSDVGSREGLARSAEVVLTNVCADSSRLGIEEGSRGSSVGFGVGMWVGTSGELP